MPQVHLIALSGYKGTVKHELLQKEFPIVFRTKDFELQSKQGQLDAAILLNFSVSLIPNVLAGI
jgi:hypothetical protein